MTYYPHYRKRRDAPARVRIIPSQSGLAELPGPNSCQWGGHFSTRGWATIQDQINAGYPIYAQPGKTTGSYTEVIDFGVTFASTIINLDWSNDPIVGVIGVTSSIEFSADNISWSSITLGRAAFGTNVRYVRVKLFFSAADDHYLAWISNFQIFLDVKHELDSGRVVSEALDPGGTVVFFNKQFKDIDSITLGVDSITPLTAIYDFIDIPNPLFFKILVYDSAGNRTTHAVSWKARGIV